MNNFKKHLIYATLLILLLTSMFYFSENMEAKFASNNILNNFDEEVFVGFIELYYGENNLNGNLEIIEKTDNYQKKVNFGRVSLF
ncbi:MAG: hypothetical protein U5K53_08635 [Halanaerobiales bacterium]|nr:hypothetical protein [Halanaerobiales bacterium]